MMSIPATKGFEIGSGFEGTKLRGSVHNDPFGKRPDGSLGTTTNRSGGIQVIDCAAYAHVIGMYIQRNFPNKRYTSNEAAYSE